MNNAELLHRWANQVKPHGKSGNVFYEGPILYSYGHHFPLAVLTGKKAPGGREIVLVNSRKYSVTTGSHKSQARHASSHMHHIYVPRPTEIHPANLEYLNEETETACEAIKGIRSYVDRHEAGARHCVEQAKLYRRLFLGGRGHVVPLPKDFAALLVKAREREARYNAAQAVINERRRAAFEEQRKLNALAAVEKIAAWRAGENVSLSWGLPCMLRLKGDDTVETSLRAEIPLDHAKRVYRLILGVMAKGEDWETNGHTIPVGVYKIDRISKNGELRAGCHTITFEEIDRFAAERGWK